MSDRLADFRSDTVTRPTPAMRQAIADAVVGDDVFKEDPTVRALEERLADMLGKEAALYVPSGTMSNQLAVRVHCGPGDEFLCETGCHIYAYEQAGYAQLSGVAARTVDGQFGILRPEQLAGLIRSGDDHVPFTKLVCLENTHNRGGGRIQPLPIVTSICDWAHRHGLATHLDGARLFNAVVASGVAAREWSGHFDTVSVCFSKGLGAPIGSALAGPRDMIVRARRARKLFGGGMRQAGMIAAAALYALEHHIDRLAQDHAQAKHLGAAVGKIAGLKLPNPQIDTNIVIFDVDPNLGTAAEFTARLRQLGVLMLAIGRQQIRAVTHLDVDAADTNRAVEALGAVVDECRAGKPGVGEERSAYA
ncbi:MAG: aminotransferase class I/II-fold pyridoxal phosphate-dependent enzyme [Planctomycetaceae bacterium]|nr:aminotransferase class I/II-fold pyridoxal phosphate-dependent enzyme [Planctomycetaceae bacterium]